MKVRLDALVAGTDRTGRIAADPLAFPRRYAQARDQEVAGLLAALFAYGRVDLFRPAIERLLRQAEAAGGPRAWVDGWDAAREAPKLADFVYRWNRGADVALLIGGLRRWLGADAMGARFPADPTGIGASLAFFVDGLRGAVVAEARASGLAVGDYAELPRGVRMFLAHPADNSACKRWNLLLRWMVRPADGVDLGLWTHLSPAHLIIPLDTHVHRIARLVGLTDRKDGSWRTAAEVTAALSAFDAADPVRYDFALAHLGISGACEGRRVDAICGACPLQPVCRVGG